MRTIAILLACLAVLACRTEEVGRTGGVPGTKPKAKLPDDAPKPPPEPELDRPASHAPQTHAGSGREFTPSEREFMAKALKAFRDAAPDWPALREEWVAMGPAATRTLVENLFQLMVLSGLRNFPEGYDRARKELVILGAHVVPTLTGILERPVIAYRTAKGPREENLPTGIVNDTVELLLIVEALPELIQLTGTKTPSVRRASMRAIGRLDDPAGVARLARILAESEDWTDRMTAAQALGQMTDERATQALVKALDDPDYVVVIEALKGLAIQRAVETIPAIEKRHARARKEEDLRIERACEAAAKAIREQP